MIMILLSIVLCLIPIALRSVEAVRRLPHQEQELHGRRLFSNEDTHHEHPSSTQHRREEITHPDDHLVTSLPLLADGTLKTRHWAGHLPASKDPNDKKIFYWLFEPDNVANAREEDIPLILWINGGPGCSSMDGLWLENGPLRLKNAGNKWVIDVNEHSWNNAPAWTVYVDQPVGTGLSFTRKQTYCNNDFEVNRDFHYFLEELFLLHSDKFLSDNNNGDRIMRRPFYFTGESHAGHYIPSMIDFILQRNDGQLVPDQNNGLEPLRVKIPVRGAAIGNGWVNPFYQYAAADAAYGAGIIGTAQRANLEDMERECQSKLKSGSFKAGICFSLLDDIIDQSHGSNGKTVVSQYDTRLWEIRGASRSFPLGHKDVETYLGGKRSHSEPPLVVDFHSVLESIHALESLDAGLTYQECTDPPYLALAHQDGVGVVDELVRVLDHE